jgi:hypothetical protein
MKLFILSYRHLFLIKESTGSQPYLFLTGERLFVPSAFKEPAASTSSTSGAASSEGKDRSRNHRCIAAV